MGLDGLRVGWGTEHLVIDCQRTWIMDALQHVALKNWQLEFLANSYNVCSK